MTAQQVSRLMAALVRHQAAFSALPSRNAKWAISHTRAAIALIVALLRHHGSELAFIRRQLSERKRALHLKKITTDAWYTVFPEEDVVPSEFRVRELELVPFLKPDDSWVRSGVVRQRARRLRANLGLQDALRILKYSREIPVSFRGKELLFPGTILRLRGGMPFIVGLCYDRGRWRMYFRRFGEGIWARGTYADDCRLVRACRCRKRKP